MARTSAAAVQGILKDNWDQTTDLEPFILTASIIVGDMIVRAAERSLALPSDRAELIERWLAAHCYQQMDRGYAAKTTAKASATFQGKTGMYFENTFYGQMALSLDPTGLLSGDAQRESVAGFWLGTEECCWDGG